jgi:hypothetical protein
VAYRGEERIAWCVVDDQLGTPRGGVMSTIVSFSLVIKPKFNRPVGERNHF